MKPRTLYEWFDASVRSYPARTALEVGEDHYTYAELDALACRLAHVLRRSVAGRPRRVGLLASRSPVAYGGYLAAQRIGASVVPLSPDAPASRNVQIARAAGLDVVLLHGSGSSQAESLRSYTTAVLCEPSDVDLQGSGTESDVPECASPDDVAYILFTSGSTGRPKGVPILHRNVSDYIALNRERYGVEPGSRLSQTFDLTFDLSVFDMFVAWSAGAALVVPQKRELLAPVDFVNASGISHWFSVPAVGSLASRLGMLSNNCMPTLRWSLFCGEPLTQEIAAAWQAAAPNSRLANLYGPTELTISCSAYTLPLERQQWPVTSNGTVPIGSVYPGHEYLVVDSTGAAADDGELCVRGPQRFFGYLDPADNRGRFIPDANYESCPYEHGSQIDPSHWYRTGDRVRTENGLLVHKGRLDDQVKIHGHRVELGEIEAVMRRYPGVHDAVIVVMTSEEGAEALAAVYTGEAVATRELRALLTESLPWYMIPRFYRHMTELPLNTNRKIDRNEIARLVNSRSNVVASGLDPR
ncbi:amino acid adenylation domain-containing protein [Streptomyces sp. NPDC088812]|uniref:amino acid adenylation domain-containing protein n=1 Tax=Streptomyces sp. NPDC088812 TaxID=3365905 RepID=UPI0038064833